MRADRRRAKTSRTESKRAAEVVQRSQGIPRGHGRRVMVDSTREASHGQRGRERAARGAEEASERIRDLNEQILERIKGAAVSPLWSV
jgi:hypothetical protein